MNTPNKRIIKFINKHHILTLATSCNEVPYCSNCFYAYSESENLLIFSSDKETKHIQDLQCNDYVGASIVLDTNVVGKIRGLQINGKLIEGKDDLLKTISKRYMKRFPFAKLMNTTLWALKPDFIKMTDNRLGFGKKLIWDDRKKLV